MVSHILKADSYEKPPAFFMVPRKVSASLVTLTQALGHVWDPTPSAPMVTSKPKPTASVAGVPPKDSSQASPPVRLSPPNTANPGPPVQNSQSAALVKPLAPQTSKPVDNSPPKDDSTSDSDWWRKLSLHGVTKDGLTKYYSDVDRYFPSRKPRPVSSLELSLLYKVVHKLDGA